MRNDYLFPMGTNSKDFDTFWAAYPRKVSKHDALKAWHQVGVDGELLALILRALAWQTKTWDYSDYMRFVPLPATWLRGRRWEDECPDPKRLIPATYVCSRCLGAGGFRDGTYCDCPAGERARAGREEG